MSTPVKPIPDGFHSVTPYLVCPDVAKVIQFLKDAFGAKETLRMDGPNGSIGHASVLIGDSMVMMGESCDGHPARATMLYLYVPDVDAVYERAIKAGGTNVQEPKDQFYGDRSGAVKDPGGNEWWIATQKEELSTDELKKRALVAKGG